MKSEVVCCLPAPLTMSEDWADLLEHTLALAPRYSAPILDVLGGKEWKTNFSLWPLAARIASMENSTGKLDRGNHGKQDWKGCESLFVFSSETISFLINALLSKKHKLAARQVAARALERATMYEKVRKALIEVLKKDKSPNMRCVAANSLGSAIEYEEVEEALLEALKCDRTKRVRIEVDWILRTRSDRDEKINIALLWTKIKGDSMDTIIIKENGKLGWASEKMTQEEANKFRKQWRWDQWESFHQWLMAMMVSSTFSTTGNVDSAKKYELWEAFFEAMRNDKYILSVKEAVSKFFTNNLGNPLCEKVRHVLYISDKIPPGINLKDAFAGLRPDTFGEIALEVADINDKNPKKEDLKVLLLALGGPVSIEYALSIGLTLLKQIKAGPFGIFVKRIARAKGCSPSQFILDKDKLRQAWSLFAS